MTTKSKQFDACLVELDEIVKKSRLRYEALKAECDPDKMSGTLFEQKLQECADLFNADMIQHDERWKHLLG